MTNINKAFVRWKEIILITAFIKLFLFGFPIVLNSSIANLFDPWIRWDGPHYIDIAKNWYQTVGEQSLWIVFYPLYPILIKILNILINNFSASAILISTTFSFIASVTLFELTLLDFEKRVAFLAVWFLNIFPTAFFMQASYTESVYLALSLLTIFFYRKNRYLFSSITGFLTTMTRVNGVLLLPLLIFESKQIFNYKRLQTLLLIPCGFLIYLFINYISFGDFFYFTIPLLSNWYKKLEWPWIGINNLIIFVNSQTGTSYYLFWGEVMSVVIILFFTIFTFLKIRKSYGVYMLLNFVLFISTSFIISTPRYALSLFPIFIGLGMIKNKLILLILSLLSLCLLLKLGSLYTQGLWAF